MPKRNEQMGRILKELADYFVTLDAENRGHLYEYSDEDCVNALITFNHITGNRLVHKMLAMKVDIDGGCAIAAAAGGDLGVLFKGRTGIDPKKYYIK